MKKKFIGAAGLIATIMAILGVRGLIPILSDAWETQVDDVTFCFADDCPDISISQQFLDDYPPGDIVIQGDKVTLSEPLFFPGRLLIVANEVELNGETHNGVDSVVILTRKLSSGRIFVNGKASAPGGTITVVAAELGRVVEFQAKGGNGPPGVKGAAGLDGADGRCEGFGAWKPAQPGGGGGTGGRGGDAGTGGSILIITNESSDHQIANGAIDVAAGAPGDGGEGGRAGRGGRGCVGLGGSQTNALSGEAGMSGKNGKVAAEGSRDILAVNLADLRGLGQSVSARNDLSFHSVSELIALRYGDQLHGQ